MKLEGVKQKYGNFQRELLHKGCISGLCRVIGSYAGIYTVYM